MSKLPTETVPRNSELMQKADWGTGEIKPATANPFRTLPGGFSLQNKKIIGGVVVIVILVGLGILVANSPQFKKLFTPSTKEEAEAAYEYPVETVNMAFPSDFLKQKFLENYQKASKEENENERYKLFAENFAMLKGFYASTHAYDFRVSIDEYKKYMEQKYPKQYKSDSALYDYECLDKLCATPEYASEVKSVIDAISQNQAIDQEARDQMLRSLDAATVSKAKDNQFNTYTSVLSSLVSEYGRTKDEGIKSIHAQLLDYLAKNFEGYLILDSLKI